MVLRVTDILDADIFGLRRRIKGNLRDRAILGSDLKAECGSEGGGGGSSGFVQLSNIIITTPRPSLVFALSELYDEISFLLVLRRIKTDVFDSALLQTSEDEGSTYFTGANDYENFRRQWSGDLGSVSTSSSISKYNGSYCVAFDPSAAVIQGADALIWIEPGDVDSRPLIRTETAYRSGNGEGFDDTVSWFDNRVTVLSATDRQNKIRLVNEGAGNFISGVASLYTYSQAI